jgi:stalled ribosome alternative rescue factor ArfA
MATSLTVTGVAPVCRNPLVTELRTATFRKRIERKKTGRASYTRKVKHRKAQDW